MIVNNINPGFVCLFVFFFQDRVSLYSPGYTGTHSVDQTGLKLRNLPASASQVLGLKTCTTTAWLGTMTLIPHKVAFRPKPDRRDKEGHCILKLGTIHPEVVTIVKFL